MKSRKGITRTFFEHERHLLEDHLEHDRNFHQKELRFLKKEWDRMRNHLHRIEALIEKQEELEAALPKTPKGGG